MGKINVSERIEHATCSLGPLLHPPDAPFDGLGKKWHCRLSIPMKPTMMVLALTHRFFISGQDMAMLNTDTY